MPINVVQAVMGHEQASTTLNRYTHTPADFYGPVRKVFGSSADDLLTLNDYPRSGKEPIKGEESR